MSFLKFNRLRSRAVSAIFLIAVFFLSSCSRVEWAVRFADTYLSWKISSQFDFSGDSKKVAKREATNYVRKMRTQQLPILAQLFSQTADELENLSLQSPLVSQLMEQKILEAEIWTNTLLSEAQPFLLRITNQVEEENWESFLTNFKKDSEKMRQRPHRCAEKFEDNVDNWMGRLNTLQKSAIHQYCESRGDNREIRARNRDHLLGSFRASLPFEAESFNQELFQKAVQEWLSNHKRIQSLDSQNQMPKSRKLMAKALAEIWINASSSQKEKLVLNLKEKSTRLRELAL